MFRITLLFFCILSLQLGASAQESIPLDTTHWEINARSYVLENYAGQDAIYLQQGMAVLKDTTFLNGTIEFDVYLTDRPSFPGVRFRITDDSNMESFYLRPHQSGNPDANQAIPVFNGISAWQLYFGPQYSVPYHYHFDDWTHVKIVLNGRRGQVYLDHAEQPHLSWNLVHEPQAGRLAIGGSAAPAHYANFRINKNESTIVDFAVPPGREVKGLIPQWQLSDKFAESALEDPSSLSAVIKDRRWGATVKVDEGVAANISREVPRPDQQGGNTVFAKVNIRSDRDQQKLFEFGYSDRVVVILNGEPIYRGNNGFRSRDYRYLGTIGLFDAVYLNLKEGDNTLLLAVSENFGGWLVTGRFADWEGIRVE